VYEIVLESDEVTFHNKGMDSSSQKTISVVRNSVAPDPNLRYKLRFRAVNGGTAPASTTTLTSAFVTAVDYTEILVELTGAQGNSLGSSSLGVNITGGSVGVSNATIGASTSTTGTAVAKINAAATTNATLVKSTSGRLYGYHLTNTSAATKYVRIYNLAAAPTVGTSVPTMIIPIPPNASTILTHTIPIAFTTGIAYSITGSYPDLDATAVAVGEVVGHLIYI
jgi:hypothetical protein